MSIFRSLQGTAARMSSGYEFSLTHFHCRSWRKPGINGWNKLLIPKGSYQTAPVQTEAAGGTPDLSQTCVLRSFTENPGPADKKLSFHAFVYFSCLLCKVQNAYLPWPNPYIVVLDTTQIPADRFREHNLLGTTTFGQTL